MSEEDKIEDVVGVEESPKRGKIMSCVYYTCYSYWFTVFFPYWFWLGTFPFLLNFICVLV